jgi:uncharacterized membrane protein
LSKPTFGEALADRTVKAIGSWTYMIIQTLFLILWITLNVTAIVQHWDPYPFILLNLFLSFIAAYTGPILLIAANRQAEIDRKLLLETHDTVMKELKILNGGQKNASNGLCNETNNPNSGIR